MSARVDRAAVYRIFSSALDIEPHLRGEFVAAQCRDLPQWRAIVEKLLAIAAAETKATGLLLEGATSATVPNRIGREYGHFRVLELLGAGGMGTVYRAERTDGVPQIVAVKVLREGFSAMSSSRFLSEARILARLEHPAVARLIDVGIRDNEGWIAMEFVRGRPITEYCASHHLDIAARLRLLSVVADAVATAHRMLVVHRDIKPTNVLVTDAGEPKLIDFGIAAALRGPDETHEPTVDVRRLFTPHYAAPEQVRGEPVTVATDVFGLGALAYRLLTGCEPFALATSAVGYLLMVTQQDVEPPSRAASAAGIDPRQVRKLRGDLDAILIKALERDPARRYAGVQLLQADFGAHLNGLPVSAHPPSLAYRFSKFARRRALPLGLVGLLVLGVALEGAIYGMQERRVSQAREAAARRGEFLERVLKSADPRAGRRDITVAELLDSAQRTLGQSLGKEPLAEASMLGLIADTNSALGRYKEGLAASDSQLALLNAHDGGDLEIARALISRGELLRASGRYADGVPVLRRAVALLSPLSEVDADRAVAFNELGQVLANSGAEPEAETLFRQAIKLDRHLPVERRGETGAPLQNLAVMLGNEGRYAESVETAREALDVQQQYLPADHPDLLTTEQTYAMTLLNAHDPAHAESLLRDIAARSARVRGPNHSDTLVAQAQLGEVLIDLGRFAQAEAILRPTAETLDRIQGSDNRYATGTWSDYVIAACSGEDAAAGLEVARRIDVIRAKSLPANDWHRMAGRTNIGLCMVHLHRYAEAESILLNAAADLEAARGPGFYTTQLTYKALRELYQATGRDVDAAHMTSKIKR